MLALAVGLPIFALASSVAAYYYFFWKKKEKECKRCGRKFKKNEMSMVPDNNYKCPDCGFQTEFFSQHTILRDAGQTLYDYSCKNCTKRYKLTRDEFDSDQYWHCNTCDESGTTTELLQDAAGDSKAGKRSRIKVTDVELGRSSITGRTINIANSRSVTPMLRSGLNTGRSNSIRLNRSVVDNDQLMTESVQSKSSAGKHMRAVSEDVSTFGVVTPAVNDTKYNDKSPLGRV